MNEPKQERIIIGLHSPETFSELFDAAKTLNDGTDVVEFNPSSKKQLGEYVEYMHRAELKSRPEVIAGETPTIAELHVKLENTLRVARLEGREIVLTGIVLPPSVPSAQKLWDVVNGRTPEFTAKMSANTLAEIDRVIAAKKARSQK